MKRLAPLPEEVVVSLPEFADPVLILLTGPRGSGKTRWCERLSRAARVAELTVAGLVSPAVFEAGVKTAIDLLDLPTGTRRRLAERPPPGVPGTAGLGWRFEEETIAWGNTILGRTGPCDLLVIDELGPLEFRDEGGLSTAFAAVEARRYRRAVVVVRPELLDGARARWPWTTDVYEVDGTT